MTPASVQLGLCHAVALELVGLAASAPASVKGPLRDRSATWQELAKRIASPPEVLPASEQATAELLEGFQDNGHTSSVAQPSGVITYTFRDELLSLPRDFEQRVEKMKLVRLNFESTSGGDRQVSNRMISILRAANIPVRGCVTGFCASAHVDVFCLGCTHRVMHRSAQLLVHASRYVFYASAAGLAGAAAFAAKENERQVKQYSERTGLPYDEVAQWFDGKDRLFDADSALSHGLVDQVVDDDFP